jgi:hypothetical protein
VLFFFEAGFFVLAILTIVLAEAWDRGLALALWSSITLLSLLASPLVRSRLERTPPADRAEARWRSAVADSWRHLNKLLLIGLVLLAAWWWIGTQLKG